MLEPTGRSLYVDALRPPVGYRLAEAVATTYSLDLTTMLGIPIALALPHLDARTLGKESAVTLLDAIRRTSDRVTVFCNRGSMGVPGASHVLYGQLEKVIVEVGAPGGGCLHSKLWALRFAAEEAGDESLMRLVVLSRNLSADRCWDVCATFDGHITGRNRAANRPLYNLVSSLPKWAVRPAPPDVGGRAERLASQLHRTEWELPRGFEEIAFHVLGLDGVRRPWLPEASRRLVVISPFVRAGALAKLSDTTDAAVALISRGEELDRLPADVRDRFNTVKVLHERAETESSEETVAGSPTTSLRGLHAKVYIAERGWNTHWYVGSANATHSALLEGMNIELLVELIGKTSKDPHKGIDGLLADDGLGAILTDYRPAAPEIDPIEEAAQRALDNAVVNLPRFDGQPTTR